MAAGDRWNVTFRGTGGHGGATPHLSTDVLVLQAQFIMALQTIVSRNVAAIDSAVISVGAVHGGSAGALNVMPAEVVLGGTARSYTTAVRDTMERRDARTGDRPRHLLRLHAPKSSITGAAPPW